MNNPDKQAWELFFQVNAVAASAGNNNAFFETWANDGDTFKSVPAWPGGAGTAKGGPRALSIVRPHLKIQVVPGGNELISEETRHNRADFDFIVQNNLYKVSGLKAAYGAGKTISFPVELPSKSKQIGLRLTA